MNICLLMMIKNESKIILNALESTENIVDSYFICDSGSTDDSKEKIVQYMDQKNIPGKVVDIPWKNFGYSKSIMMERALNESGADFFIFFDAKEVLVNSDEQKPTKDDRIKLEKHFNKSTADVFMLTTFNNNNIYRRWSALRNNQLYIWKSPAHEYLVTTLPLKREDLDILGVKVNSVGSSGGSTEKYLKYVELLKDYIEEDTEPHYNREIYYIAQSYKDAGKIELGIEWYKKRIDIGDFGTSEEPYISMLTLYWYYKPKDEKEAIHYLLMMKRYYPYRLEGMHEGMSHFDSEADFKMAYVFGKAGYETLNNAKRGYLFKNAEIYNYRFLFLFSLMAHHSKNTKDAYEAGLLLKDVKMPEHLRIRHDKNMVFYKLDYDKMKGLTGTKEIVDLKDIIGTKGIKGLKEIMESKGIKDLGCIIEPKRIIPSVNLLPNLVVIDNILPDPDSRRAFALKQDFKVNGNYPGHRTVSFATDQDKSMFEYILNTKITYWSSNYNGAYQYTTKDMKSWIHRDSFTNYSAIIFLTPDPLITGGTETFVHKDFNTTFGGSDKEEIMNSHSQRRDKWDTLDSVGCLYNRLIIFNGKQSHQSRDYFGTTLEDARLFQIFFFSI